MTWVIPAVVGVSAVAGVQQAGAIGKYTQSAFNRKAKVDEQKAEAIENQLTLDLSTFDKKFRELEGSVIVQTAKSGVTQGGTAARIRLANLTNAELEKNKMKYDTEIGKARAFEEANFARIRGQMARQESKIAQLKTLSSVGTSLLTMRG